MKRYLVLECVGTYEAEATFFDSRPEVDAYLYRRLQLEAGNHAEDYQLLEVAQEFDVVLAVDCYTEKLETLRNNALSKLTIEEKLALGISAN